VTPSAAPSQQPRRNRTWMEEASERASRAAGAGSVYFLALAAAGWAIGPGREAVIRRGASGLWTTLVAAPALLLLLAVIAALAIRAFRVKDRAGDRLLVGSLGVTLLVAAELLGGPLVRSWGPYESLSSLLPEPSIVFLALLTGAVLTPLLEPLGRRA
jgi:hypothetical protein